MQSWTKWVAKGKTIFQMINPDPWIALFSSISSYMEWVLNHYLCEEKKLLQQLQSLRVTLGVQKWIYDHNPIFNNLSTQKWIRVRNFFQNSSNQCTKIQHYYIQAHPTIYFLLAQEAASSIKLCLGPRTNNE